jgi:hypothetical protein
MSEAIESLEQELDRHPEDWLTRRVLADAHEELEAKGGNPMAELSSAEALYLALDELPGDPVTTRALADWYEEQGNEEAAECLRWAVERERWPFQYRSSAGLSVASQDWGDGWFWWAVEDRSYGREWGHPASCRLPAALWEHLPHTFTYGPAVFKEYPTLRAAYEALFAAWPKYAVRR